jgi:hypothetical protein
MDIRLLGHTSFTFSSGATFLSGPSFIHHWILEGVPN